MVDEPSYEYLGISTVLENGWSVEHLIEHEGWEFYWGTLRRPIGDKNK
jgi:hypothetical protein